jgi:hypothetical protein
MEASSVQEPFDSRDWIFETKRRLRYFGHSHSEVLAQLEYEMIKLCRAGSASLPDPLLLQKHLGCSNSQVAMEPGLHDAIVQ